MSVVIQVDRLSKQYRLGQIGSKRLVDDVSRWWARVRGKEDPLAKVGQGKPEGRGQTSVVNGESFEDRNQKTEGRSPIVPASLSPSPSPCNDTLWALRDVSFEVKQGEVLGIIGRNGAGKSTLLKILSRVTGPTSGEVRVKGRIASLLEVGTGFHPELTGRENIYLNGAILGMTKPEIRAKFDEIVDFSGVEQFIDTPVKRYSSGMTVRLAFAVAAHLEPEILIVDEVLAVGDAEFQKKCLGKMHDVAGEGRTILFVTHNLRALSGLCPQSILLKAGRLHSIGLTDSVMAEYSSNGSVAYDLRVNIPSIVEWKGIYWPNGKTAISANQPISFELRFQTAQQVVNRFSVDCAFTNHDGRIVVHARALYVGFEVNLKRTSLITIKFDFDPTYLAPGFYNLKVFATSGPNIVFWAENVPGFQISGKPHFGKTACFDNHKGVVVPAYRITINPP